MVLPGLAEDAVRVAESVDALSHADLESDRLADGEGGARDRAEAVGDVLFAAVGVARALGVDPETALLARARAFRSEVEARG